MRARLKDIEDAVGTSSPHPFNLNGQPCYIYFHLLTYEFLNDVEMIW